MQQKTCGWMRETCDSFVAEISLGKSKPTVEAYSRDIRQFLGYLAGKVSRLSTLKPGHIVDYLGACKAEGKSDASVNRYYMSIRAFCRFLRKRRLVANDLTEDVPAPQFHAKAPYIPTQEEIGLLLNVPHADIETGARDRAILELLYSSGLRASELCSLELEDFRESYVVVKRGKRSKTRTVPLTDSACKAVLHYLNFRGREPGFLFLTELCKPVRRELLYKIVKSSANVLGLTSLSPHTLRHACATHLLDAGADLRLIQEVLGHASISSTQRYTHLSSVKMQEMFHKFHPRGKNG